MFSFLSSKSSIERRSRQPSFMAVAYLLTICPDLALGEIKKFNSPLVAASNYIHFSGGYLVEPGYVDLSGVKFITDDIEKSYTPQYRDDDGVNLDDTDDSVTDEQDHKNNSDKTKTMNIPTVAPTIASTTGAPHRDWIAKKKKKKADAAKAHNNGGSNRDLDGIEPGASTIDIVLFHEPSACARTRKGCDWTKLGVGASDENGNSRYCCSSEAATLGFCDEASGQKGRLIVDSTSFQGEHRFVPIPASGKVEATVRLPKIEAKEGSGKYTLVLANCNDSGRNVTVKGPYVWKSKHGYLPGDLFSEWSFYIVLSALYFALFLWYGLSMRTYKDSKIAIQNYVMITIFLGLLEMFFRSGDYWIWNEDGTRAWYAVYTWIVISVVKRAISRCLVVMVGLGWGVIRDTLGERMKKIVFLGLLYVVLSLAHDITEIVLAKELQTLQVDEGGELYDFFSILTFVVAVIDVIFYMWILDSLNNTMEYLENMNQSMKLKRYLRLRLVLLISILFALVWAVFGIVNVTMEAPMLADGSDWAVAAAWDLNYLFILCAIAVLWKPNASAKEYAFVMELPSVGADMELDTNIDTINDDDDDQEDITYRDSPNKNFQIDDAEVA